MSGRIRTIKPEILEDDKTAHLSDREWRLFVSMFSLADDYGNLRGTPGWISAQILWAFGTPDVSTEMEHLEELGLIESYDVAGQRYLHITNWARHQRVDKPGKPRVPGPKQGTRPDWGHGPNQQGHGPNQQGHGPNQQGHGPNQESKEGRIVGQNEDSRESRKSQESLALARAPVRAPDPDPDPNQRPPTREEEGESRGGAAPPGPPAGSAPAPPRPPERPRRRKAAQDPNGGDPDQPRRGGKKDFPQDWAPNDHAKEVAAKLRLDLEGEAESFRAYYGARGKRMVDWDLAFYGWLRKSGEMRAERADRRQGGSRLHPTPQPLNDKPLDVRREKF